MEMENERDCNQLKCNAWLFAEIYTYDVQRHTQTCQAIKKCLALGADINAVDRNNGGNTILHVAVGIGCQSLVSFLLANGAKTSNRNEIGFTVCEWAKQKNCDDDIIELLGRYSQHEVSRDQSHSSLWTILQAKPKASYIEIDYRGSDRLPLLDADFYRTIDMFENLVLVDVLVNDETPNEDRDSVIVSHLKSVKNPIIMQCRSSTSVKVYFKESQTVLGFLDLNSVPMEVDFLHFLGRLDDKESFGIRFILEGLIRTVFGKFNTAGQISLLGLGFLENRYNGLRLIDYAVKHNHLLAVRWLRLDLYNVQWKSFVFHVQSMTREMLAALLKVDFPIPVGKIELSTDVIHVFRERKDDFFRVAAYNVRQDLIEFLLQCTNEMDYKDLIKSFVDSKRFKIVLAIIKADGLYPDNFDSSNVNVSFPSGQKFVEFVKKRNDLHDLIVESTLENVKEHFGKLFQSKLYLNTKNESALVTALRSRKLDIYRYLLSQSVDFKDNTERQLLANLDFNDKCRLREQMIELISHVSDSSIDYLLSKTRVPLFQLDEKHKQQIKSYYKQLNDIPEISNVIAVVQYSDYLDIIFDFDHESTIEMDPMTSNNEGFYYPALGRIYIGAKGDEKRLLGVIAHELTHLAMQLVYFNRCKPYFRADIVEELQFSKLVVETSQLANVDDVIGVVYKADVYRAVREAELIVRVNHMLALYGLENGEALLKEQVPHLLAYYRSKVIPQCVTFYSESHLIKMRRFIQDINRNSGIIRSVTGSNIRFKSQIFNQHCESKRIVFFVTTNTRHITNEICRHFKDTKRNGDDFTYLNGEDLPNFKYGLISMPHVFVVTISSNSAVEQSSRVVVDWINNIFQDPNASFVLVLSKSHVGAFKAQLQRHVPDGSIATLTCEHLELERFLESEKLLFIFKSKNPRLSTINIYQQLKTWFFSSENSVVFVKLSELHNTFHQHQDALISDACKLIVLESAYDDLPKDYITQFENTVEQSGKKFIVVTPVVLNFLLLPEHRVQHSKIVHSVSLNDLSGDSIELLLDHDVKFQGKLVKMKDLIESSSYDVVDAKTIIKLAIKDVITIGKELAIDVKFYVPRTLSYGARVQSEWLKKYLKNQELSNDVAVCIENKKIEVVNLDSADENRFHRLCEQHPEMDIHWLKGNFNGYICKKSKSTPTGFKIFKKVADFASIDHLSEDNLDYLDEHQLVIVSDVAGMGKTTLLTHIAQLLKEKHPYMWINQVNLNMYTKVLDEEAKNSTFEPGETDKALNFFVNQLLESRDETKLGTDFETVMIVHCITTSGAIVILFDAFDELKRNQQNVILKLIKSLQKTKVRQMWVTTRPHRKEELENELSQFSLKLVHFTENNQLDFLTAFWMQNLESQTKVRKFAEVLLKRFNECISDKERELTGIPLQTRMLAEAFEIDCTEFLSSANEKSSFTVKLDFIDLYERFIKKKFDIWQFLKSNIEQSTLQADLNRKKLYSEFLRDHQLLALFALFGEQARDIASDSVKITDDLNETAVDLFPYGIITNFADGQPQFIHRTFAEYFTAEYIVDRLINCSSDKTFIRSLLCNILVEDQLKVVRNFINMQLSNINDNSANFSQQRKAFVINSVTNPWTSLCVATREGNLNIFNFVFNNLKDADCLDVNCDGAADLFFTAVETSCSHVTESLLEREFDVNYVWKPV